MLTLFFTLGAGALVGTYISKLNKEEKGFYSRGPYNKYQNSNQNSDDDFLHRFINVEEIRKFRDEIMKRANAQRSKINKKEEA
uniref:YtxH domain-containing protein n=1 Tax=Parastrongyloides trichosuri TaxID=131310 RepID=A0A0N4ZM40_PARTI